MNMALPTRKFPSLVVFILSFISRDFFYPHGNFILGLDFRKFLFFLHYQTIIHPQVCTSRTPWRKRSEIRLSGHDRIWISNQPIFSSLWKLYAHFTPYVSSKGQLRSNLIAFLSLIQVRSFSQLRNEFADVDTFYLGTGTGAGISTALGSPARRSRSRGPPTVVEDIARQRRARSKSRPRALYAPETEVVRVNGKILLLLLR